MKLLLINLWYSKKKRYETGKLKKFPVFLIYELKKCSIYRLNLI